MVRTRNPTSDEKRRTNCIMRQSSHTHRSIQANKPDIVVKDAKKGSVL